MKVISRLFVTLLFTVWAGQVVAAQVSLLQNGSFEAELGEHWVTNGTVRNSDPLPYHGSNYIYGLGSRDLTVEQEIDLGAAGIDLTNLDLGNDTVDFGGWQAGLINRDFGLIILHFLDTNFGLIDHVETEPFTSNQVWVNRFGSASVPAGTRYIRYIFNAHNSFDDSDTDALFDYAYLNYSGILEITDTVEIENYYPDAENQVWAQPKLFRDVPWADISAACPGGKCSGSLNGFNLDNWVWATSEEVQELFDDALGTLPPTTVWPIYQWETYHHLNFVGSLSFNFYPAGFDSWQFDEVDTIGGRMRSDGPENAYAGVAEWFFSDPQGLTGLEGYHSVITVGGSALSPEIFEGIGIEIGGAWFRRPIDSDDDGIFDVDDPCPNARTLNPSGCVSVPIREIIPIGDKEWLQPDYIQFNNEAELIESCPGGSCIALPNSSGTNSAYYDGSAWTVGTAQTVGELFNAFIDSTPFTGVPFTYAPAEIEKFAHDFFDVAGFRPTRVSQSSNFRHLDASLFPPYSASMQHKRPEITDRAYITDNTAPEYQFPNVWLWRPLTSDDLDNDGVLNEDDFYPNIPLVGRLDTDGDGIPDECDSSCLSRGMTADPDDDGDGFEDDVDTCPLIIDSNQSDGDNDGAGDLCDVCPADSDDQCDTEGSAAAEVTASEGGRVETPDGQLEIFVDPGDLLEDTTISITETVDYSPEVDLVAVVGEDSGLALAFYELGPDGLEFSSDITVNIVVDVTSLTPLQRNDLGFWRLEDTTGDGIEDTFRRMDTVCSVNEDPAGTFIATCAAQVDHFSSFAIIVPLDTDMDGVPDKFNGEVDNCRSIPNEDQEPSAINPDCGQACVTSSCAGTRCVNR